MTHFPHHPDCSARWPYGCPFCGATLDDALPTCPQCTLPLVGQRADRLSGIDRSVARGDAQRASLLLERTQLLGEHAAAVAREREAKLTAARIGERVAPPSIARTARRFELKVRDTQTVLLALGGLLLGLAALVFAVMTWRDSSEVVQAGMLLGLTVVAGIAPVALRRRGLRDTAETVAALAGVLAAVDGIVLQKAMSISTDGRIFWAVATTILVGAYVLYARLTHLVAPYILGAVALQAPLLLTATVAPSPAAPYLVAATAAIDGVVLWLLTRGGRNELRAVQAICGSSLAVLSGVGVVISLTQVAMQWGADARVTLAAGGLLVYAAISAVMGSLRPAAQGTLAAVAGSLSYVGVALFSVALMAASPLDADSAWAAGATLLVVSLATLVVASRVPAAWRTGLRVPAAIGASVVVAAVATVLFQSAALAMATEPVQLLSRPAAIALHVSIVTAAAIVWLLGRAAGPVTWWPRLVAGVAVAAAAAIPLTVSLNMAATAVVTLAIAAVVVAVTVTARAATADTWFAGMSIATFAVAVSITNAEAATVALAGLLVLALASAYRRVCTVVAAPVAVVAATLTAGAAWLTAAPNAVPTACIALGVPLLVAVGIVVADRLGRWAAAARVSIAVEITTAVVAGLATIASVAAGAGWLAWSLAGVGLAVLAQSVRADRHGLAYPGLALLTVSSWIHLVVADVALVEAYSVPVSLLAIGIGARRRHVDATVTSAQAYGAPLMGAFLPSLLVGVNEGLELRAILVLVAAALVALAGARARLSAPLIIGALVAVVDGLWLSAPALADAPRWATLAAVGAALLFVGATYERRRLQLAEIASAVRSWA